MLFVPVNPLKRFFKVQSDDAKLFFAMAGLLLVQLMWGHWGIALGTIMIGIWFWLYLRVTPKVNG
jgi:hypothetical protein